MIFNIHLDGWLNRWLNRRKPQKTLVLLQKNGLTISTVYDIGANKGRWSRDMQRVKLQTHSYTQENDIKSNYKATGSVRWIFKARRLLGQLRLVSKGFFSRECWEMYIGPHTR